MPKIVLFLRNMYLLMNFYGVKPYKAKNLLNILAFYHIL